MPPGLSRAQHAERDAEDGREEHGRAGELQRLWKSLADVLRDRAVGDVRAAEVARQRRCRRSGAKRCGSGSSRRSCCAQARDRRAVGALADHRFHRIAGRDVEQQKRDDEHAEERRDREQQAANDEARSCFVLVSIVTSVQRWPLKITGGTKCLIQGCTAYSSL